MFVGAVSGFDLALVEALATFRPELSRALPRHRSVLIGAGINSSTALGRCRCELGLDEEASPAAKVIFQLFPQLSKGLASRQERSRWTEAKRACGPLVFNTLFYPAR